MKEKCYLCRKSLSENETDMHEDCKFLTLELWDYMERYDDKMADRAEIINAFYDYCDNFVCPHCSESKFRLTCWAVGCPNKIDKAVARLKEYKLVKVQDEWQEVER